MMVRVYGLVKRGGVYQKELQKTNVADALRALRKA